MRRISCSLICSPAIYVLASSRVFGPIARRARSVTLVRVASTMPIRSGQNFAAYRFAIWTYPSSRRNQLSSHLHPKSSPPAPLDNALARTSAIVVSQESACASVSRKCTCEPRTADAMTARYLRLPLCSCCTTWPMKHADDWEPRLAAIESCVRAL